MSETSLSGLDPKQLRELLSVAKEPDALGSAEKDVSSDMSPKLGCWIDQYKLIESLGEGGMAIVYLAEQEYPVHRKVAIKIIKPGMNSAKVIARFEAERQTLTFLSHPNIAQIYDAGTTKDGLPYFVMEYVKGLPITEYCDDHKLTNKQRLNLFRQVCLAVNHAHQKGIIHRDIKPSNILVSTQDDQAVPKIIDFGIAKAIDQPLSERTLVTEDSQLLGTPEYMSPEQADMATGNIDTRTDVYSLGVLLYVLLTGVLPFEHEKLRDSGIENIRKVIRETDPNTPSTRLIRLGEKAEAIAQNRRTEIHTLAKYLRKELEWIPLKAMRKERSQRYRSASEFADDIENYLSGTPLIAGPPSTIYRLKKFVRRNRALVTGFAAVLIVLIIGVVGIAIFAIKAERRYAEAQVISNFLRNDVLSSARQIIGRESTVRDVLNAASKNIENSFVDKPLVEGSIRKTLGRIYFDLGDYKASSLHREREYRIYLNQLGEAHRTTRDAMNWLAVSYNFVGKYREAEELWETLIHQRDEVNPIVMCNLAVAYSRQGRYKEAEQLFLEAFETARWGPDHNMTLLYSWDLAKVYREQGRYEEAEELFIKTLQGQRQKYEEKGEKYSFSGSMIRCMNELAWLYMIQNRYDEAEALFLEGIEIGDSQLPGKDHPFTLSHVNGLAMLRTKQQRYEDAEKLFNRALEGRKLKLGEDHPHVLETINDLGILHRQQKHFEKAEELLTEALEGRKIKLSPDHPTCFESMHELAVLYKKQTRYKEAELLLLKAIEGRRLKLGDTHPHTIESINNLIDLYEAWNKPEEAKKWHAKLPKTEAKIE